MSGMKNQLMVTQAARRIEELFGTFIIEGSRKRDNIITRVAFVNALVDNKKFPISYSSIGDAINKDHSTVIHYRKSKYIYEYDALYIEVYNKTRSFVLKQEQFDGLKEDSIIDIIENIKELADLLKMSL